MKKTKDYQYWIYEQEHSTSQFFELVEGVVRSTRIKINVLMLNSQKDLSKEFQEWAPSNYYVNIGKRGSKFILTLKKNDKEPIRIVFIKHPQNSSVYFAISDCKSTDFKYIFTPFISKYFPIISKIFLTNNEMNLIFKKLEKSGHEMIVEYSVAKKRQPGAERPDSYIHYTNQSYKKVFEDIFVNDRWIQGIRYKSLISEFSNPSKLISFKGTITRDCYFSIRYDTKPLFEIIIPYALELASARNEYLKISVDSAKESKPEPVIINFEDNIFEDVKKNKVYVDALAQLPSSSISEYHTNPYIHISLIDYRDGSSYDIWVLSKDRMAIIPQFSVSNASMRRLVNHIFERVHEGKVEKYEEIQYNS